MEPYNYIIQTAQQPNAFDQGLLQGRAMKAAEEQRLAQAAMQQDLALMGKNPTVANIAQNMAKYPQFADKFKPLMENATEQQKQNRINQAQDVFVSLGLGKRDAAMRILQDQADAARNAGDERGAKSAETMKQLIESSETGEAGDRAVFNMAGTYLASAMGPENFQKTYETLLTQRREGELHPSKLKEAQSNADKAAVAAKFAESDAALDLQKKGWDITKIQNDIEVSKQNARIATMNAAIAREGNDLKRQELALKIEEAKKERDDKVSEKVAVATSAADTIDNMLSTAQMILNTSKITQVRATGPLASKLPTVDASVADFEELVNTLGSQVFLSQVQSMKGMGALSDAEGKKLQSGLQNLSLRQSKEQLMGNVKEIQRLMLKARQNLANKYGVPISPSDLRPGVDQRTVTVDY